MATQSLPRDNAISELSDLVGERLTTSVAVREQHGYGECGVFVVGSWLKIYDKMMVSENQLKNEKGR